MLSAQLTGTSSRISATLFTTLTCPAAAAIANRSGYISVCCTPGATPHRMGITPHVIIAIHTHPLLSTLQADGLTLLTSYCNLPSCHLQPHALTPAAAVPAV